MREPTWRAPWPQFRCCPRQDCKWPFKSFFSNYFLGIFGSFYLPVVLCATISCNELSVGCIPWKDTDIETAVLFSIVSFNFHLIFSLNQTYWPTDGLTGVGSRDAYASKNVLLPLLMPDISQGGFFDIQRKISQSIYCNFCHRFTLLCRQAIFVTNLRTFQCKIFRPQNASKNYKYEVCHSPFKWWDNDDAKRDLRVPWCSTCGLLDMPCWSQPGEQGQVQTKLVERRMGTKPLYDWGAESSIQR